jgi:hypothetical protein
MLPIISKIQVRSMFLFEAKYQRGGNFVNTVKEFTLPQISTSEIQSRYRYKFGHP